MIVYLYDSKTGEFLDTYSPQKNPKQKGKYLYPKYSTTIKPENKQGYVAIFDGEKWDYIHDYRGEEIINPNTGESLICQNIGELPEEYVLYSEYVKTEDYRIACKQCLREEKRKSLLLQIDELDKKRIRAISEPEQKTNDITWLEYYTAQIIELRKQLQEV